MELINATEMCKKNGKMFGNYYMLSSTKEYLRILSNEMKVPIDKLVEIKRGGDPKKRGTMVNLRVAIHLAVWLSPEESVKMIMMNVGV